MMSVPPVIDDNRTFARLSYAHWKLSAGNGEPVDRIDRSPSSRCRSRGSVVIFGEVRQKPRADAEVIDAFLVGVAQQHAEVGMKR